MDKRKIIFRSGAVLLALILILGALTACGKYVNDADKTDDRISLIVELSDKADSAKITVRNDGKQDIAFGEHYIIQKKTASGWKDMDERTARSVNLVLFLATAGEGTSFTADWSYVYGTLPSGEYRIKKPYQKGQSYSKNNETYYAYGEFKVD